MPNNNDENSAPDIINADFFKKFKRWMSYTCVELLIKLTQYLKALKTSSINKGIHPINFDMNMIKNKLVYTILSLNLIDGVFLL